MKTKPKNRLGLQLLVITIIATICTWLYLTNFGSVNKVVLFKNATDAFWNLPMEINLPFASNRILNILLVIAFCYVVKGIIEYLDRPKHRSNEAVVGVILGIIFGAITGASLMVAGTINHYVEFVFGGGLAIISFMGIMAAVEDSIASGLKLCLATAIITGLIVGMMVGLETNFSVGLLSSLTIAIIVTVVSGTATIIVCSIKSLFQRKTWDTVFSLLSGPSFND